MTKSRSPLRTRQALLVAISVTALLNVSCGASDRVREEVAGRRQAAVAAVTGGATGGDASGPAGPELSTGSSTEAGSDASAPGGSGPSAFGGDSDGGAPGAAGKQQSSADSSAVAGGGNRPDAEEDPATTGASDDPQTAGGADGAGSDGSSPAGQSDGAPAAGGATDVGVTADTIRIGSTFFNGGFLDKYSQASEQAVRAYVKFVNEQGGIHGRRIDLVTCDTQGTVNGTQGCVKKLLDQDEVFMLGPGLDFNMGTVVPLVTKRQVPWVGTAGLEDPEFESPYLFPAGMPGGQVGNLMATFSVQELGAESIGVSYLKNGAGPACLAKVEELAEPLGYKVKGTAANGDTESDLSGQVTKIRQEDPDIIVFCNDPVNNIKFMQAAARQNYAPPLGWINGYGATDDVPQAIGPPAVGMYAVSGYDFYRTEGPAIERFRAVVQNYYPNIVYHSYMQANYVGAEAMVQALVAAGPELTRESMLEALRSMSSYDTGMGLVLDFSNIGKGTPTGIFVQADENLRFQPIGDRIRGQ